MVKAQTSSDAIKTKDDGETREVYVLPQQKPVVRANERIVTAIGGVQSGKTFATLMGLAKLLASYPGETCYLLAPVFSQIKRATLPKMQKILEAYDLYDRTNDKAWNKTEHYIDLQNGARLSYLTASDPEKFQGVTTPGVMIDEIQEVDERVLDVALERTAVMEGTVYLSGLIPHPQELIGHWIYDRIYKPYEEGDEDIKVFKFSSEDNPFFPQSRYEKAKEELPEPIFAAEYKGEFRETTLTDNVFVPSSINFCQQRWSQRIKFLPKNLYTWVKDRSQFQVPDYEEQDIAKAQGSYLREEPSKEDNKEVFQKFREYKRCYGVARHHHGNKEDHDYEQTDPEAGIVKYDLNESANDLLIGPQMGGLQRKIYIGVDVADQGGDITVATIRWGNTVLSQLGWVKPTNQTVEDLEEIYYSLDKLDYEVEFWIDAPGFGKAVVNDLRAENIFVQPYWPSDKPPEEPKRYANLKAWLFFEVRNRLLTGTDAIPPVEDLRRQLLSQKYDSTAKSKLKIAKDKNDSPDYCDSYVISSMPVTSGMNPKDNVFFI